MTLYTICIYLAPRVTTLFSFFFFNATPTTEIYTLSLHDALPISLQPRRRRRHDRQRHGFRLRPLALFPDPRGAAAAERAGRRSPTAPRRGRAGRRDGPRRARLARPTGRDRRDARHRVPRDRAALPRQHDGARAAAGHRAALYAHRAGDAGRGARRTGERDRRRPPA